MSWPAEEWLALQEGFSSMHLSSLYCTYYKHTVLPHQKLRILPCIISWPRSKWCCVASTSQVCVCAVLSVFIVGKLKFTASGCPAVAYSSYQVLRKSVSGIRSWNGDTQISVWAQKLFFLLCKKESRLKCFFQFNFSLHFYNTFANTWSVFSVGVGWEVWWWGGGGRGQTFKLLLILQKRRYA